MKILFVTPLLPSPPRAGSMRRMHGLITSLAEDHSVSILSYIDQSRDHTEEIEATREYCDQFAIIENDRIAMSGRDKRLMQLRSMASPYSFERLSYYRPEFQKTLDRMASQVDYDVINVTLAPMGYFRLPEGPVSVLDEHNIEYDILRRTAQVEEDPFRRLYNEINYRKLRREEQQAWRTFDACTVTSTRDQEILLSDVPEARTAVVPNGVETSHFSPMPEETEPHSLVFVGANYYPNVHGIRFFLRDVMPRLRERYPDLRLYVVGEAPPDAFGPSLGDEVVITGYVDDIRQYIARAGAVIVPLFVGGGTRLKVLEGMAMAKPIVSTSLGAEGLDVEDGKDILLADDADTFVRQISSVFDDPVRASAIGQSARTLAENQYDWKISAQRLRDFYQEILEQNPRNRSEVLGATKEPVVHGSSRSHTG